MILYYFCPTLGQKLKKLRLSMGLTQVELGANIGIDGRVISRIENDIIWPDKRTLEAIAFFFRRDIEYFINDQLLREGESFRRVEQMLQVYEGSLDNDKGSVFVNYFTGDKSLMMGEKTFLLRVDRKLSEGYNIPEGTDLLVSQIPTFVSNDRLLISNNGSLRIVLYECIKGVGYIRNYKSDEKPVPITADDEICGIVRGAIGYC